MQLDSGANLTNSASQNTLSVPNESDTSASLATNSVLISVADPGIDRCQVESPESYGPSSSSSSASSSSAASSSSVTAASAASVNQLPENFALSSRASTLSSLGSTDSVDISSHWLAEFFHLALDREDVGSDDTFDRFLLRRECLLFGDDALAYSIATSSDGLPKSFVEYSPPSEILELVQFSQAHAKYHETLSNIWRVDPAHYCLDDDDGDDINSDLCACHVAIPSALLSQWQVEEEQITRASEENSRADSVVGAETISKLTFGKRSSVRLQSSLVSSPTFNQSVCSFPTAATKPDVCLVSSSSSSSSSSSLSLSGKNHSMQTRALEERAFSSSAAMHGACCGSGICLNRVCMIECSPKCRIGLRCQNQRFRRRQNAEVEARPTFDKGWGLFACKPVAADTFMIEYCGEVIDKGECERRIQQALKEDGQRHLYHMALTEQLVIDATTHGSRARFLNHSCEPNCRIENWTVGRERRIGVFSARPIGAHEELTINYRYERNAKVEQLCFCGARTCQGFIGWRNTVSKIDSDVAGSVHGKSPFSASSSSSAAQKRKRTAAAAVFRESHCFVCQGNCGELILCDGSLRAGAPCAKVRVSNAIGVNKSPSLVSAHVTVNCVILILSIFACWYIV